ncbi:LysM domain-containing protein [Agromyces sp. PvR057]|uniref:LysM peptidoglycan-binding domain-containing protein n=1 Tax=Agromyces sp. PvR057 TaxID=3156403 RepID=UPI0033929353
MGSGTTGGRRHPAFTAAAAASAAGALVIGTGLALSGCVPQPAPAPATVTVAVTETVAPTPIPTPTPTTPPVAEAPAPEAPAPVPNAPAPVVEPGPAYDLGARDGAMGTPAVDGSGMPISYVVVAGDSFFDIAQRFDLPQQQLLRMNPQIHDYGEAVYIGDAINLDWTKTG